MRSRPDLEIPGDWWYSALVMFYFLSGLFEDFCGSITIDLQGIIPGPDDCVFS
jgi:hypothetical protein